MGERTCTVDGCEKVAFCRGWCPAHYQRWRKTGAIGGPIAPHSRDVSVRFWEKVDKNGPGGCWLWLGARGHRLGYGRFYVAGGQVWAYRWAYEDRYGPIPDGFVIDHLCRVPACVNPDHLQSTTQVENVLRGVSPQAINARKTRCKRGHELSGDNLRIYRSGSRACRTCARAYQREYRSRTKGRSQ